MTTLVRYGVADRREARMPTLDLTLTEALARAVDDEQLVLHLQPEVDLADGTVVGMEALLRWRHPTRGLLRPADFLPLVETSEVGRRIGDWVLHRCVQELVRWRSLPPRADGRPRRLWMNVAPAQLGADGFAERVADLLAGAGLPAGALGIELTEEALGLATVSPLPVLEALRNAGVLLAVDDFGTWYSSLATLGELPVDAVKLDRSFVRGVGADPDEDEIVASVVRLAHARDLEVVAEGVESRPEADRLTALGCDRALGYLFGGPQPAERARLALAAVPAP